MPLTRRSVCVCGAPPFLPWLAAELQGAPHSAAGCAPPAAPPVSGCELAATAGGKQDPCHMIAHTLAHKAGRARKRERENAGNSLHS